MLALANVMHLLAHELAACVDGAFLSRLSVSARSTVLFSGIMTFSSFGQAGTQL